MAHSIEVEIQRNYAAFLDMLENLLPAHLGKYVLLHNQELAGVFETPGAAARDGFAKFGDAAYSIQIVTDEPVDLGFISNAVRSGSPSK